MLAHRATECGGPRHQHRHQIRHRCAGNENAARRFREAEHLARPFDDLTFNLKRNMVAAAEIGIEPGRQHFRQHADRTAAAVHPSHESGMNVAGRIRQDEIGELAVDFAELRGLPRKLRVKPRANFVRYRLPDRPIPDVGGVIDHVIEHAMTQRADLIPVLRIERLAGFGLQRRFAQRPGHAACSRPCRAWR